MTLIIPKSILGHTHQEIVTTSHFTAQHYSVLGMLCRCLTVYTVQSLQQLNKRHSPNCYSDSTYLHKYVGGFK